MSLPEGARLGHYEILSLIGAGGMGEVYRARDERLGREVAVKILREGASEDHLLRFEQEARAASALDHPSIIHIYEIGEYGGKPFIAMEYARGPTLRLLLLEAPLPPKKILSIGTQIAEGLAKAHDAGIIHRDLKPENLIVTPDGFVKILDFGLAKLFPGLEADSSASATTLGIHTRSGLVPGTVGYTSPEQASGRAIDFRADQFCLGLILYETATGKRAFFGNSVPETLTAIIREEPEPISGLNPRLPPPLRWIIERCLSKNPNDRYASTSDLARDLRDVQERLTELSSSEDGFGGPGFLSGAHRSRRTTWVGVTIAGALVGLAAVAGFVHLWPEPNLEDAPLDRRLRLLVSTEDQAYDADLSPDGKMVAYVAEVGGQFDLFVGRVAGGARVRLTNDVAREADPDFSPDGETVAFARQLPSERLPDIGVIPSLGGEFRIITRAAGMPAWSPDGRRLVAIHERSDGSKVLIAVTAAGTERRELLDGTAQYPALYSPAWSPDGRTIAVRRSAGGVSGEIWTVSAGGGEPKRLWEDPPGVFSHSPVFERDGTRIVHSSNRAGATNLWSASVDGRQPPKRLTTGTGPDEYPSVADDGSVAFLNSHWRSALLLHDLESGATEELLTDASYLWAPAFSPDGRELAFSRAERDGSWHIWTIPVEGGEARQLSSGRLPEIHPRFSPDGDSVIYFTWSGETDRMWRSPLAGGPPQPLTSGEAEATYGDLSPDGRWLAYAQTRGDETRVRVAPIEGGEGRDVGPSPSTLPRWSPDGRFLVFARDRSYASGVFLVRPDGSDERRLSDTGGWPVWLPDGEHVAYLIIGPGATQQICVVPVTGGECDPITSLSYTGTNYPIDFSPDGRMLATSNGMHLYDEIWLLEATGAE